MNSGKSLKLRREINDITVEDLASEMGQSIEFVQECEVGSICDRDPIYFQANNCINRLIGRNASAKLGGNQ